nr:hypothetical protein [Massilia sp. Dwa41.01b]
MVSKVVAAIVNMATIQPGPAMRNCISGENTNWPNEPPALMKPDAKGRRQGQALGGGTDQDRETPRPRPCRREHAHGEQQAPFGTDERRGRQAAGQQQRPEHDHARRAVFVGDRAEDGLRGAPHELADRQREADGGHAQAGRAVERREKQARGQARAHRDHQDRAGGQDQEPGGARRHVGVGGHGRGGERRAPAGADRNEDSSNDVASMLAAPDTTACYYCQFGRGEWTLEEAELDDPRHGAAVVDGWDGLVRLIGRVRQFFDHPWSEQ